MNALWEDRANALWVGTAKGLVKRSAGAMQAYSTADGLPNNVITSIYEDNEGSVWIGTNGGVSRRRDKGFEKFTVQQGLNHNLMGGSSIVGLSRLELPPGQSAFEIHYTALSFVAPARVRFKYRLVGFDRDWVDAAGRRVAYYTNIRQGSYGFQVIAQNNDGVWNQQSADLAFYLAPQFYQTTLFYSALAAALLLGSTVLFRLGVRHMRRRGAVLEEMVADRTHALREGVTERRRAEDQLRQQGGRGRSCAAAFRRHPDGRADAGHERFRSDSCDPRGRGPIEPEDPYRRHDGPRDEGRP